jgi:hypothetical protein
MFLRCFLGDLLTSFRLRRPLLSTMPLPDPAPLEVRLPLEILSPVQMLFQSLQSHTSVVAIPTQQLSKERLEVVDEIMASKSYATVEEIHAEILEKSSVMTSCMAHLEKANRELYWRWKDFLRLKSSVIRIIRDLPDVVEAIAGKARAGVAKPIIDVLSEMLRKEHGLIIYDASPLLEESLVRLALQMIKAPQPDNEEVARRVAEIEAERKSGAKDVLKAAAGS